MPENLQKVSSTLRKVGMSRAVDECERKMNLAAEEAAIGADLVFVDAVRRMSRADAKGILNIHDTATTDYFREKTTPALT
jgi:hypothetical protein